MGRGNTLLEIPMKSQNRRPVMVGQLIDVLHIVPNAHLFMKIAKAARYTIVQPISFSSTFTRRCSTITLCKFYIMVSLRSVSYVHSSVGLSAPFRFR